MIGLLTLGVLAVSNMANFLVTALIVLAIISVAWWVMSKLTLPEPVKMIIYVIGGIVAIIFLLGLLGGGSGMHLPSFH